MDVGEVKSYVTNISKFMKVLTGLPQRSGDSRGLGQHAQQSQGVCTNPT